MLNFIFLGTKVSKLVFSDKPYSSENCHFYNRQIAVITA